MELPNGFLEQMKCLLGEEYPEYLESFSRPAHSALRVNTGKIPVREFLEKNRMGPAAGAVGFQRVLLSRGKVHG